MKTLRSASVCAGITSFVMFCLFFSSARAQELTLSSEPTLEPTINAHIHYGVSRSYKLGVGDVLALDVLPQQEYSRKNILIRSDGKATFPSVGEMDVSGKTIDTVVAELKKRLNPTIRNYTLTIEVTRTRPAIFYLTGAVNKMGPFEMITNIPDNTIIDADRATRRTNMTLTNILTNGGGIKLNADLTKVEVKRRETGEIETVDLWSILKAGEAEQDLWLNPGDGIFVPELPGGSMMSDEDFKILANSVLGPKNFPIRVLGEVQHPTLVKLEGETPLLSTAIVLAGGFAPQAKKDVVAVRRFTDANHFTTLFVDTQKMDLILRPNDIVYIGENRTYKAGRFMQEAAKILSPFSTAAGIGANASQSFGFGGWRRVSF